MAAAPAEALPLIADLLARCREIAPAATAIEERKEQLRAIAGRSGGFVHPVQGIGKVTVSRARPSKFVGQAPELVPEIFLAMTDAERAPLLAAGVVITVDLYTKPAKATVSVTLT